MMENLSQHYLETCSPALNAYDQGRNEDNIALFYHNIKAACGIDDELRCKQARKAYSEVLKQGRSGRTTWSDWITQWERAMRGGKLRGITEVQHAASWFDDLQDNLSHHFEVFMRVEKGQHKEDIVDGKYQPSTLAANFRQELMDVKNRGAQRPHAGRIAKGAFKDANGESKKRNESPNLKISQAPQKRQRKSQGNKEMCILCDRPHQRPNSTSCWVAFPENMPKTISLTERQQEDWEERLNSNNEVRELFESLQTIKRSSSERKT
jgi:hypothetical protein